MSGRVLGVQMYALRGLAPLGVALDAAVAAGVRAVELKDLHELEPPVLRQELEERGLEPISAHVALARLEAEPERVAREHREVGHAVIAAPWLAPEDRPADAAGWRALGARLARVAERLEGEGARLLWHHHDFELADVGGATGLDHLLDAAGPALGLELDVGWCLRAGADPLALLRRYGDRTPFAHLKDVARPGEGADEEGWADLGAGVGDWPELARALGAAGVQAFVLEHDAPPDPAGWLARSAAYARELLPDLR